jgi:hypothetical protein
VVDIHLTPTVDASFSAIDGGWHLHDYLHGWESDETWPEIVEARWAFEHAEVHWVLS